MNYDYAVVGIKKTGSLARHPSYLNVRLKLMTQQELDSLLDSIASDVINPGGVGAVASKLDDEYPDNVATFVTKDYEFEVVPIK